MSGSDEQDPELKKLRLKRILEIQVIIAEALLDRKIPLDSTLFDSLLIFLVSNALRTGVNPLDIMDNVATCINEIIEHFDTETKLRTQPDKSETRH